MIVLLVALAVIVMLVPATMVKVDAVVLANKLVPLAEMVAKLFGNPVAAATLPKKLPAVTLPVVDTVFDPNALNRVVTLALP